MSRNTTLAKIAAMAQLLDEVGLHDDADILDECLGAISQSEIIKEAGLWKNILSRLSGWARQLLFSEYREMYKLAKEAQASLDEKLTELQNINEELKQTLSRHELPAWRKDIASIITSIGGDGDKALAEYDELYAKMTARVLKLAPKINEIKEKKEKSVPALLPEESEETKEEEKVFPLTEKKEKTLEKQIEEQVEEPPAEKVEQAPVPPVQAPESVPAAGWKKERFGTSGKHGWEWEWEVSPDGNKIRIPKNQLAAASIGQGKILHRREKGYFPTEGTASVKLRKFMGPMYWKEGQDPSDPNMVILTKTDNAVSFPLSTRQRQKPVEQVEKLKELGKLSEERVNRIIALAEDTFEEESDEDKLDSAAQALLNVFEHEEDEEEHEDNLQSS